MFDYLVKARNSRKRGFTIIEMVVVIAIIGILSSILVPNFSGALSNARTTSEGANIATMNKIAKTAMGEGEMSMLKGYAAAVQNFGHDSVKTAVANAVYNRDKHEFVKLSKVKDKDDYDLANYYPIGATEGKSALEDLVSQPFVQHEEYPSGKGSGIIPFIINKAISDDANKYTDLYIVKASIALYDDLDLSNGVIVFLDGASVELNGRTLGTKATIFLDTSGGEKETKFYINGGKIDARLGFAFTSIKHDSFYDADGKIKLSATVTDADFVTDNKIEVYQDAQLWTDNMNGSGMYINVARASYYLFGGIMISGEGSFTLDGTTHFVVKDGAYLLAVEPSQSTDGETQFSAVKFSATGGASPEIGESAVVSLKFLDGSEREINGLSITDSTWNSINPMTYEICARAVENMLVLYAQAGADQGTVMAICDKFGTAVNQTVTTLSDAGLAAFSSGNGAATIANINASMTSAVFGAVSAAAAGSGTVASAKNAVAATSLAGTSAGANISVLTAASAATAGTSTSAMTYAANASVVQKQNNGGSTTDGSDYSFYAQKSENNEGGYTEENGVKTYHIKTAQQLYSLSWAVAKGEEDFYGSIVSIEPDGKTDGTGTMDLSAYSPWQPIGNGKYGFRGTMDGHGNTISGMTITATSTITSLIGEPWSGTASKAAREGVNFGVQTGDKYAVGFIGTLENGGSLSNLKFANCNVTLDYDWNCSAAIAVGNVIVTGEDYSWRNGGRHITSHPANGYAVYGEDQTVICTNYNATGPKWIYTNGVVTGAKDDPDVNYRAYKGWVTSISNVQVLDTCTVVSSGRSGGIVGSVGDRFGVGTPNNEFGAKEPWKTAIKGCTSGNSIFSGFGTFNVTNCSNAGTIKVATKYKSYSQAAGIVAYYIVHNGNNGQYTFNITNCTNSGDLYADVTAGMCTTGGRTVTLSGCSSTAASHVGTAAYQIGNKHYDVSSYVEGKCN